MKFESQHVEAFHAASHDKNPLHLDANYARRSQFGRPVVYGMAAVLYGLGAWAAGRAFRLGALRVVFRKALFVGEEYELQPAFDGSELTLKFKRGPVDYTVISASVTFEEAKNGDFAQQAAFFAPQSEAAEQPIVSGQMAHYQMNLEAWPQLKDAFGLHPQSLPLHQLSALLWASYHVGMLLPGRQALFSELQVTFSREDPHTSNLTLELLPAEFDERFGRYVVEGKGPGIAHLRIAAFRRPLPVDFSAAWMPDFERGNRPLAGKVVFISGATRGFGAAMAQLCARAGARLALNYRGDSEAAHALREELAKAGCEVEVMSADMADAAAVAEMADAIVARFGKLDFIVNNAAPPIRDLMFLEQDNAHFLQFVQQNLAITLETARQLLPLLSDGGQFVHISTKYLTTPVRGFSHYLTAKAAQETLVQALSLEFRNCGFVIARLPRILTDQTNLAFDFDPPQHPGEVARALILEMAAPVESGNWRLVNVEV